MQLPFHSISFTLVEDRRPRAALRLTAGDGGMYELHVEKGSAANPVSQFTREVPLEVAQRLKDALQEIGVFGWAEQYGDAEGRASRRWTLVTVFTEGVFSVSSKGGSDVPAGFGAMLEELYRLDFPRPNEPKASGADAPQGVGSAIGAMGMRGIGGLSAGDLGAYSAAGASGGVDFSRLAHMMGVAGLPGFDASQMGDMLSAMQGLQGNPQALQQRMRDEFRHMSPDEQSRLLDTLAATGMASRAWWERFFRGL